jgi:cell division septation protein DedD
MQDIDFSRYYRKGRRTYSASEAPEVRKTGAPVNKLSLYLAIAFSSLAIGFIGGTQLQKNKMMRELENRVAPESAQNGTMVTANVAAGPAAEAEKAPETVRTTRPDESLRTVRPDKGLEGSFLILAKIYPDEKEASLAGLNLKRNGMKAFMARNGKKVKLYVGPIDGKAQAYEALGQLKKNPEFAGAILYRK